VNGLVFVVCALVLILAAVGLIVRALTRSGDDADRAPERVRDWLRASIRRELEDARAAGDLRSDDLLRAESDLRRMVEDYGRYGPTKPKTKARPGPTRLRTVLVVFVIVATVGLYAVYGGWRYVFFGPLAAQRHDLRVALHRYHRHLARHPDDVHGWRALARGYELLGHDRRAARAYAHLVRHGGGRDPTVLADYAQALILASHGRLDERELALTNRALALDPVQPKALWWGGLLALAVAHDRARALRLWNRLLLNPALPKTVRAIVASRVVALGGTPAEPVPSVASQPPQGRGTWLVTVTDAVRPSGSTPPGSPARLYVFFRDPLHPHQPPYYVRAVVHPVFPLTVALSRSDSPMGAPNRLPREVELVALWSRDGRPTPRPGDLEGRRIYSRAYLKTAGRLSVRIDRRIGPASSSGLVLPP